MAGPEKGFSSKDHATAFSIVRSKCINVTLHSGEGAGWESIQDSIRYCGANRYAIPRIYVKLGLFFALDLITFAYILEVLRNVIFLVVVVALVLKNTH